MDNFDQRLKEIIEQTNYGYKASSWRKFSRKSGVGQSLSTLKAVSISLVTAGILSAGGYLIYKQHSSQSAATTATELTTTEPAYTEPTLPTEEDTLLYTLQEESTVENCRIETPATTTNSERKRTATTKEETTLPMPDDNAGIEEVPVQKSIVRDDNWRVVIINTDTIGSDN